MAGDFEGLKGSSEIILVTDGENTCGPDPCKVVETVLREKRIKVRIDVVTIELNPDPEEKYEYEREVYRGWRDARFTGTMPAEEEMVEQLNQAKIPGELREAFQSNNCPLTKEAKVTSVEDRWLITDGIKMYSVEKGEKQLKVYTSCRRTDMLVESGEWLQTYSYLIKGPVVYVFKCYGDDMIYEDMLEKYYEPMLASFEPIVEVR